MNSWICTGVLYCTPEINSTLWFNYAPINKNKKPETNCSPQFTVSILFLPSLHDKLSEGRVLFCYIPSTERGSWLIRFLCCLCCLFLFCPFWLRVEPHSLHSPEMAVGFVLALEMFIKGDMCCLQNGRSGVNVWLAAFTLYVCPHPLGLGGAESLQPEVPNVGKKDALLFWVTETMGMFVIAK